MTMTNRERLWTITAHLIDGLAPHFGIWAGTAKSIAYENIMGRPEKGKPPKLSDSEIQKIVVTLISDMDAP